MAIVYIGLGSNLGNRWMYIEKALEQIRKHNIKVLNISRLIETDPVGGPPQGLFLNGVIKAETDLSPLELLHCLKSIELHLGRVKTVKDGPRVIDLDILLYDRVHVNTPELTIPHPRMKERDFVLNPLREIAPELVKELLHEDHP